MPTPKEITHRFTYHAPSPPQLLKYTQIREQALEFGLVLNDLVPDSPELSTALRKLDEVVMHANAGIARRTPPVVDPTEDTLVVEPPPDASAADTVVEEVPFKR